MINEVEHLDILYFQVFSFIIFKTSFQISVLNLVERKCLNSSLLNVSGANKKIKQYRNETHNKSQEGKTMREDGSREKNRHFCSWSHRETLNNR